MWASLTPSLLKCLVSRQESERLYLCHFWNVCINTGKWASLSLSLLKCLYHDRKVSEFNSITFEMFVSWQECERFYLCHFWNVCIKTGKWATLTPSLLKCLNQDRKESEFNSVTFEMSVSRQESERVYLRHFWNVCIKTGKWVSLTPSLLKCFVSIQESERVYLCHFWNVCNNTGKWASLSLSLLKCLYQDRKVSEFNSITFEMFVSIQESERFYLSLLKCLYQDRKMSEFNSITFEMFVSIQESERV